MKKYILIIILTILAGVTFSLFNAKSPDSKIAINEVVTTASPTPRPGLPKTLNIKSLNLTVIIESVGKDEEGLMDIPKDYNNTAWYELGPRPGESGNSVIAGHVDTPTGKPSVFYSINTLKSGDEITVEDDQGKTQKFKVTHIKTFKADNFPVREVFGEYDGKRLNLITCGGQWDKEAKDYSDRIVVFSESTN